MLKRERARKIAQKKKRTNSGYAQTSWRTCTVPPATQHLQYQKNKADQRVLIYSSFARHVSFRPSLLHQLSTQEKSQRQRHRYGINNKISQTQSRSTRPLAAVPPSTWPFRPVTCAAPLPRRLPCVRRHVVCSTQDLGLGETPALAPCPS